MYETDFTSSDNDSENHAINLDKADSESFSLDTDIKNVMKLQKYLQIAKEKYHKEHRFRVSLENAKSSLEADNAAYKKKIEVLTTEKLSLEKLKLELELKLKQLELELVKEKAKRINFEEKEIITDVSKDINFPLMNCETNEDIQIQIVKNAKSSYKTIEEDWMVQKQNYQQEINVLHNKLKHSMALLDENNSRFANEMEFAKQENLKLRSVINNHVTESEKLKSISRDKQAKIENMQEEKLNYLNDSKNVVPPENVDELNIKLLELTHMQQEKDLSLLAYEEMNTLLKNQFESLMKKYDETNKELLKVSTNLNNVQRDNFSMNDHIVKLKVELLSIKSHEKYLLNKIATYEKDQENKNETVVICNEENQSKVTSILKEKLEYEQQIDNLNNSMEAKEVQIFQLKYSLNQLKDENAESKKYSECLHHEKLLLEKENSKLKILVKQLDEFNEKLKILLDSSSCQIVKMISNIRSSKYQKYSGFTIVDLLSSHNDKLKSVIGRLKEKDTINWSVILETHYQQQLNERLSKLNQNLKEHL